jgi:hypothetical protein
MNCKTCGNSIPFKRLEIIPGCTTCVNCSSESKFSGVPVINHKTGNEVQVVKDPEVAKEFLKKSSRAGYGTMRGISSGNTALAKKKVRGLVGTTAAVPGKENFERYGKIAMQEFESFGIVRCTKLVQTAVSNRNITQLQGEKILQLIDLLNSKE